jgi:hypothetical protein
MERYIAGKPRFLAAANGHSYAVLRLDGRARHSDRSLTLVYNQIRTRREAEQAARRLARQGGALVTNIKCHVPLAAQQERMKRRHGVVLPVVVGVPVPSEFPRYRTPSEVAEILGISCKSVVRRFEGRDGVLDHGSPRNPTETDRRTKYRVLAIPPEAIRQYISEHRSK